MCCLHPRKKIIKDAITGEMREIIFPCGHCINCQAEFQDMWSIRLQETAKYYKQYIYDTITIAPWNMTSVIDFTKPTKDGTLYGSTERYKKWKVDAMMRKFSTFHRFYPRYDIEVWKMLRKTHFKVYSFDKTEIQKWLKQGREDYCRDHADTRIDIVYFITEEYGPQTSRPHFHLMMFGISLFDYHKYFGHPANVKFGFTRPVWKRYTPWEKNDAIAISRYIAKYVTKGDFESPFVKCGLQKEPYRLISKGIGQGLLAKDIYNRFKSPSMTQYKEYYCPSEQTYQNTLQKMRENGVSEEKIHKYIEDYEAKCKNVQFGLAFYKCDEIDNLTDNDVKCLYCYYDEQGFAHKLPRYYIQKLFGGTNNEKNILQSKIQAVLEQSARLHDNTLIQREALALGVIIPDDWLTQDSSTWELSPSTLFMVLNQHSVIQRSEAEAVAERRKIRLTNFYNRAKLNTAAALQ